MAQNNTFPRIRKYNQRGSDFFDAIETDIDTAAVSKNAIISASQLLADLFTNANVWDDIGFCAAFLGASAAAHVVDFKDPSHTYSLVNGGTDTAQGHVVNGTSQYVNADKNPVTEGWDIDDFTIIGYNATNGTVLASSGNLSGEIIIATPVGVSALSRVSLTTVPAINTGTWIGTSTGSTSDDNNTYFKGDEVPDTDFSAGVFSNLDFFIGARNNGGSPINFVATTLQFSCVINKGIDANTARFLSDGIEGVQVNLNRSVL